MNDEPLSLQQAADELGVHYMTAYRYVRLGKLEASKSQGVWQVRREDLADLVGSERSQPAAKSTKAWDKQLEKVLLGGDEGAAWQVVEAALASGRDPDDVYTQMIAPALRHVGDLWRSGQIDVADEHRATLVATRLVGRLSPRFNRRGRSKGTFVVAAAPDDFHGLAVMMLSDRIRGAGYKTVDLGAAVPPESLKRTVEDTDPLAAVAILAFRPDNEPAIREAVTAVRSVSNVPILLGGPAIDGPNHARGLGATAYAESLEDALAELVGTQSPQ